MSNAPSPPSPARASPAMDRLSHRGAVGWTADTQHLGSPGSGLIAGTGEGGSDGFGLARGAAACE